MGGTSDGSCCDGVAVRVPGAGGGNRRTFGCPDQGDAEGSARRTRQRRRRTVSRPRIVIVGAGFAGYRTARTLSRLMRHKADVTLLNPTDYFLYLPLLPQVAAGILEPRRVSVSLSGTLPHVRLVLGEADSVDLDGQSVHYTDPEGGGGTL